MKTVTVRLPEALANEIAAESRARRLSKSDIVRDRLRREPPSAGGSTLDLIRDLIGSVDGLPEDLSANVDAHLRTRRYGTRRSRRHRLSRRAR